MNPLLLQWGRATPELVSPDGSVAIHVYNHALTTQEQLQWNVLFIRARIAFFRMNLPTGMCQTVYFDDRGQVIPDRIREDLRNAVAPMSNIVFMTERE